MRYYALFNRKTMKYFMGGKKPRLYQKYPRSYVRARYNGKDYEVVEFLVTEVVPGTPLRTVPM